TARRKTGRIASAISDQISTHDQSQNRQGNRIDGAGTDASARRRGDRMTCEPMHRRSFLAFKFINSFKCCAMLKPWSTFSRSRAPARIRNSMQIDYPLHWRSLGSGTATFQSSAGSDRVEPTQRCWPVVGRRRLRATSLDWELSAGLLVLVID